MEIKIIENKEKNLEVEVYGSDYTLMELIKKKLLDDKTVKVSLYTVEHPLLDGTRMVIETESGTAEKQLMKAASDSLAEIEEFKKALKSK